MGRLAQGQFWTPRPVHRAWGALIQEEVAAPEAGKPWKWVVPAAYVWRLVALRVVLTSSAQEATRSPGLALKDNRGVTYYETVSAQTVAKSEKVGLSVVEAFAPTAAGAKLPQVLAIPAVLLPPEFVLEGVTGSIQTEDAYSAVQVLAEQFEPAPDHPIAEVEHKARAIQLLETAVDLATT